MITPHEKKVKLFVTCMMRIALFLFFLASTFFAHTQRNTIYKTKTFLYVENVETKLDTIPGEVRADFYFFEKLLYPWKGSNMPFADISLRDQMVTKWSDPTRDTMSKSNWRNRYWYDKAGRLVRFDYSACLACSSLPYDYIIEYNKDGTLALASEKSDKYNSLRFTYKDGRLVNVQYGLRSMNGMWAETSLVK